MVTRFTYRLHEVGPTVAGGLIAWPFERADEVLAAYRAVTEAAPRELAVWLILLHAPRRRRRPGGVARPPDLRDGRCYSGDAAPERALAPIRALGAPVST